MRSSNRRHILSLLLAIALIALATAAIASPINFTGTVSYQGPYSGDSLYVGVVDTTGFDVTILDVQVFSVGTPPFSQAYSLDFDNTGTSEMLVVAAFLDVDGGGVNEISGADVFGWYAEGTSPQGVSSASSQSDLDFELPRAEIHGMLTIAPGQIEARISVSGDLTCVLEGFRPGDFHYSSGPYALIGLYPGTYCLSADGYDQSGHLRICYGDPNCASPTLITLTATEVLTDIDLDFRTTPIASLPWGKVKVLFK